MKQFKQTTMEMEAAFASVTTDEELAALGFNCKGRLCEFKGYQNFYERLWLWTKTEGNAVYTVASADAGNSFYSVVYTNLYVQELLLDEEDPIADAIMADGIKEKLTSTKNMCEIADIVDGLDEKMAKWVLKKFVYAN